MTKLSTGMIPPAARKCQLSVQPQMCNSRGGHGDDRRAAQPWPAGNGDYHVREDRTIMTLFGQYIDRQTLLLGAAELSVASIVFLLVLSWPAAVHGTNPMVLSHLSQLPIVLLPMIGLGIYQRDAQRSVRILIERLVVGAVCGFAGLALLGLPAIGFQPATPLHLAVAGIAAGCAALIGTRWVAASCLHKRFALRPVALVVGTGERAAHLWNVCGGQSTVEIAAFLTPPNATSPSSDQLPADRLIPTPSNLAERATAMGVHEIVVALDERRGRLPLQALLECRMAGIGILESTTFLERETGRVDLTAVQPSWLIFTNGFNTSKFVGVVRRVLDLGLSVGLLLAALPVMLIIALAIKADGPGPIFYHQTRVGLNGRPFQILKFRSMRTDAEREGAPQWAATDDPRVTRVGRFLRRMRLDELPQLFNVLAGDMSLIGPRPERPEFVRILGGSIPYYQERHRIRPGLTGWAQVRHDYGGTLDGARAKLEYDLYYLKNQTLLLDFSILLQTVRIVALGHGAR